MPDLSYFLNAITDILARHNLGTTGAYRRWQDSQATRDLSLNPYGCADAANILYTIGLFPPAPHDRQAWISTLRGFQDRESGMFRESTHHEIHTTAHCIAALELFDARPEYRLTKLAPYREPAAMLAFLEALDWQRDPWNASHQGAGLYAALVLAGDVTREWRECYCAWLTAHFDAATGLLRQDCVAPLVVGDTESIFPHLAGTFHYLFNLEYERRPVPYPQAIIDTCLELFYHPRYPLGDRVSFAEIDWVFCLTRSLRQCGYRYADCRRALIDFSEQYRAFLSGLNPQTHDGLNDLHSLFGVLCCLAELQTALPGQIITERPLKLVLDRRPFI